MNFTKNLSKDKYESSFKSCQSRSFFSCLLNDSTGPKDVSLSLCLTAPSCPIVRPPHRARHASVGGGRSLPEVGNISGSGNHSRRWAIAVQGGIKPIVIIYGSETWHWCTKKYERQLDGAQHLKKIEKNGIL